MSGKKFGSQKFSAMTPTQSELLSAYAAGETSPGLSLLCAAQTATNPQARAFVAMAEEVAGAALKAEAPSDAAAPAMDLDALLARLDDAAPPAPRATLPKADGPLPAPVAAIAGPFAQLSWSFRLPGVSENVIEGFGEEKVSLLRARAGARVPDHTHRGLEATLVLAGQLQDGARVLARGDLSLSGAEHHHHPQAVGEETCYCLIVMNGGLRFTGMLGRALNIFTDR